MLKKISIVSLLFLLGCNTASLQSQHLRYQGYLSLIADVFGVPISGYYDIEEDWNGFVWMATNNGLLRIDGTEAKVFTHSKTDSTLAHKIVYDIEIDAERRVLWLSTAMGLSKFDPVTEKSVHYQATYENPNSLADNIVRYVFKDNQGEIWVGCFNHGLSLYREESNDFQNFYYEVPEIDSLQILYPDVNESRLNSFKVIDQDHRNPDVLWLSTPLGLVSFEKSSHTFSWLFLQNTSKDADYLRKSSTVFKQVENKLVVGTHGEGFIYNLDTKSIDPINLGNGEAQKFNYVVQMIRGEEGKMLFTYLNGLAEIDYTKNRLNDYWMDEPKQGKFYGIRMKDSQGRIWINSSRTSAFFDPLKQITEDYYWDKPEKFSPSVFKKIGKHKLVILNRGDKVCHIFDTQNRSWINVEMKSTQVDWAKVIWNDLIRLDQRRLLLLAEDKVYTLDIISGKLKEFRIDLEHSYPGFTKALLDSEKRLWIATRRIGLLRQDQPGGKIKHFLEELNSEFSSSLYTWITDLLEDRTGNVWIRLARSYAIYETKNDRFRVFSHHRTPEKTFRYIRNFSEDPTGDVWVASEDTGLGRTDALHVEKGIVQKLSVRDGLFSDEIKQICFDQDANLWMLTKNGLSRYHSKNPNVWNYPWDRGIPEAYAIIALDDGTLAIARQSGGISLLDPNKLINQKNIPRPYITAVKVGDKVRHEVGNRLNIDELNIKEGRDYLSVSYSAFGYANPKEFAYRLEGVDADWVYTQELISTSYSNLSPKHYIFSLKSRLAGGQWSEPVSLAIFLVPLWYETIWFKIFVVLSLMLIAYSIYKWRVEDIRHQERLKSEFQQRLNEVEMQSLRSQMNPHFLFNSLNSIQLYIIKNDPEKAVEYLGRFSKLMRLILQNSRAQTVPLKQELEALQLYMELENLRFSNIFDFRIEVEPEVRVNDFEIPPMLLQPFVENAIWHGIQPKKEKGEIHIHIRLEGEYLVYSIEDNGIGRAASSKLKKKPIKQHKSMGMKITADRLEMINHDQYGEASMEIIDLYEDDRPAGTKVVMRLPV